MYRHLIPITGKSWVIQIVETVVCNVCSKESLQRGALLKHCRVIIMCTIYDNIEHMNAFDFLSNMAIIRLHLSYIVKYPLQPIPVIALNVWRYSFVH